MNFFNCCAILFLLSITISCNTSPRSSVTEMEFTVDSALVTKQVTDTSLKIKYSVPGDWTTIETPDSALSRFSSTGIRVSNILKNTSGTVVFSLTDVRKVADSTYRHMDENFKTVLNPSGTWSNVEKADFRTKDFQVKQYVMAREGLTFFKMLFGRSQRPDFQVDYSITIDSAYALNTKTLESIIGTLQRTY